MEHVLVVADDLFLRRLIREQVETMGVPVREALTPARGMARIELDRPGAVLLDPWVDHGNGLEFLSRLRKTEEGRGVPVMLVGNEPRDDVRSEAKELGAVGPLAASRIDEIAAWVEKAVSGMTEDDAY